MSAEVDFPLPEDRLAILNNMATGRQKRYILEELALQEQLQQAQDAEQAAIDYLKQKMLPFQRELRQRRKRIEELSGAIQMRGHRVMGIYNSMLIDVPGEDFSEKLSNVNRNPLLLTEGK